MTGWELDRGGGKRPRGKSPVGKRRGEDAGGGGAPDTIDWYPYLTLAAFSNHYRPVFRIRS